MVYMFRALGTEGQKDLEEREIYDYEPCSVGVEKDLNLVLFEISLESFPVPSKDCPYL